MVVYREYYVNSARYLPKLDDSHICSKLHGHTYNIKIFVKGEINLTCDSELMLQSLSKDIDSVKKKTKNRKNRFFK